MNTILVLHDLNRWLVILFGLMVAIISLKGYLKKDPFSKLAEWSGRLFSIFMDIQIVFGFIMYFNNGWFDKLKHLNVYWNVPDQRFFTFDHWIYMLTAWILIHAGRNAIQTAKTDKIKYKKSLIYFGSAILLILFGIPWPFREALGRPWFRWF